MPVAVPLFFICKCYALYLIQFTIVKAPIVNILDNTVDKDNVYDISSSILELTFQLRRLKKIFFKFQLARSI